MNKLLTALVFVTIAHTVDAIASDESTTYVITDVPLISIKDRQNQAQEWAKCAAIYNVSSMLMGEENPVQRDEYGNKANGASVSVLMALTAEPLSRISADDAEGSMRAFNAASNFGKVAMKEWPKVHQTSILNDLELDSQASFDKILRSLEVCQQNLAGQQSYIDLMRELVMSGLFE